VTGSPTCPPIYYHSKISCLSFRALDSTDTFCHVTLLSCRLVKCFHISREQQYKHGVGDSDIEGPVWNTLWR